MMFSNRTKHNTYDDVSCTPTKMYVDKSPFTMFSPNLFYIEGIIVHDDLHLQVFFEENQNFLACG